MDLAGKALSDLKQLRDACERQAEYLESGEGKFIVNDVDVSAKHAALNRQYVANMDEVIAKAEEELGRRS